MSIIKPESFLIRLDAETSRKLETESFEIERWSSIIARQISKNQRFDSTGVSGHFNTLKNLCSEYEDGKDNVSKNIVIPAATEKWGKYSNVAWSLNFSTLDITATYNGKVFQKLHRSISSVPDDMIQSIKEKSIAKYAYDEVFDKLTELYPTTSNDSYAEFISMRDENEVTLSALKKEVDAKYVTSYLVENSLDPAKCIWNLTYDTGNIDLYENVASEEEADV